MEDLQHLRNLGARVKARSLQRNAVAAMLRTEMWENTAQGGIQWHQVQRVRDKNFRDARTSSEQQDKQTGTETT